MELTYVSFRVENYTFKMVWAAQIHVRGEGVDVDALVEYGLGEADHEFARHVREIGGTPRITGCWLNGQQQIHLSAEQVGGPEFRLRAMGLNPA